MDHHRCIDYTSRDKTPEIYQISLQRYWDSTYTLTLGYSHGFCVLHSLPSLLWNTPTINIKTLIFLITSLLLSNLICVPDRIPTTLFLKIKNPTQLPYTHRQPWWPVCQLWEISQPRNSLPSVLLPASLQMCPLMSVSRLYPDTGGVWPLHALCVCTVRGCTLPGFSVGSGGRKNLWASTE